MGKSYDGNYFTDEEVEKLIRGFRATWSTISPDVGSVDGWEEMAELASDADRPVTFGFLSEELYKKFCNANSREQRKIDELSFKEYII